MNDEYKTMLSQATRMESQLHNVLENTHTQEAIAAKESFRHYKEALQEGKDPAHMRDLSHRMMQHMDRVQRLPESSRIMNTSEAHEFHQQFMHNYDRFHYLHHN